MDEMTLTLNSPITEEQWDAITDVDFDNTDEITFYTKHGKVVKFVKASAQPEIIRCKDCKYSDTDNTLGVMFCWRVSYHEASEDGFCSWAERRTDEGD